MQFGISILIKRFDLIGMSFESQMLTLMSSGSKLEFLQ